MEVVFNVVQLISTDLKGLQVVAALGQTPPVRVKSCVLTYNLRDRSFKAELLFSLWRTYSRNGQNRVLRALSKECFAETQRILSRIEHCLILGALLSVAECRP